MRVLVDTDVVSYGLRADPRFDQFYGPTLASAEPFVSFMTIGELEHGAALRNWAEKRLGELRAYLSENFLSIMPTTEICRCWGQIRAEAKSRGRVLKPEDGWIAATSVVYGIPLMTNNRRDFEGIPGLQLITQEGST
ncbi:PIN domain-containing protein [Planctomycetes bacterium TBK1r]|uniref:tRNA(fMet)-specific endonuclease VapC n=1 Tax=Stieleria magnilauensis TaxID=2527963 RepID=A0ABX5XJV9_9BACT|nr:tRNA(fMet)-specific endonuclease VapC [Planctomycetes bacterium TBK1r]